MNVRLSARTVLGIGIAIFVGCGTSGGPGGTGSEGPPPSRPYDVPPGQDPPPNDYDNPNGPNCGTICEAVVGRGCVTDLGTDVETCTRSCALDLPDIECSNEVFTFLQCILRSPDFTCDLFDDFQVQQGQFKECTQEALAFTKCGGDDGGGEGGQPGQPGQ